MCIRYQDNTVSIARRHWREANIAVLLRQEKLLETELTSQIATHSALRVLRDVIRGPWTVVRDGKQP
jgi:hypothetical protein